jgi:hypothetical protein
MSEREMVIKLKLLELGNENKVISRKPPPQQVSQGDGQKGEVRRGK